MTYPAPMQAMPDYSNRQTIDNTGTHSIFPTPVLTGSMPINTWYSGTPWVAPEDGYVFLVITLHISNVTDFYLRVLCNNFASVEYSRIITDYQRKSVFLPVSKGDTVEVDYFSSYSTAVDNTVVPDGARFTFIPLKKSIPASINENYSLNEINTGKKWIDGKDIYRRVVNTTAPGAANAFSPIYAFPFTVDALIRFEGYMVNSSNLDRTDINFKDSANAAGLATSAFFSKSTNAVRMAVNLAALLSSPVTLILEYTKA